VGLFKKSFAERLKKLLTNINSLDIARENVSFQFENTIKKIEEIDLQTIDIINTLFKSGKLPERLKIIFLRQLANTLRKIQKLDAKELAQLEVLRNHIRAILLLELTSQRIGVEIKVPLYHGTGISGISTFQRGMEEFDYLGNNTLGEGIYFVTNKKMAINYAFYRYGNYKNDATIIERFGNRIQPTVYKAHLKKGKRNIADLSDPLKIRALYKELSVYLESITKEQLPIIQSVISEFIIFLQIAQNTNQLFTDLRRFAGLGEPIGGKMNVNIQFICLFLKSQGYDGLLTLERGEIKDSVYKWEETISYLIFDPESIERIEETRYKLRTGKVYQV